MTRHHMPEWFSKTECGYPMWWKHSHKKRKDSLKGNLDRVLFVAEPEFLKILAPRLPQHTPNVNNESAGKSKQLNSLYVTSFLEYWYILICFKSMMSGGNYVIYVCSSVRTTPGVSLYGSLTLEENIVAALTQDMVIDDSFKRQIKNRYL